jgi:hypothetical protein
MSLDANEFDLNETTNPACACLAMGELRMQGNP